MDIYAENIIYNHDLLAILLFVISMQNMTKLTKTDLDKSVSDESIGALVSIFCGDREHGCPDGGIFGNVFAESGNGE